MQERAELQPLPGGADWLVTGVRREFAATVRLAAQSEPVAKAAQSERPVRAARQELVLRLVLASRSVLDAPREPAERPGPASSSGPFELKWSTWIPDDLALIARHLRSWSQLRLLRQA